MASQTRQNSTYTGEDIEVLEGLEPVRRRPSMYIGGVDSRGLHHLLWEIVDNSVDEFLAGECDRITVTLHKDGSSCTVQDNGRGIPVDKHPKMKKSTLEVILTTLHAGGKFSDKNYTRSGGLHGVGSSVVNALSSELIATVHRDGFEWEQSFKRGKPAGPVQKVKPFRGRGTSIFFRPDDDIFRRTLFNGETIRQHLEDISYIHGGLTIIFHDEVKKETHELHHPDGIVAYIEKITTDAGKKPAHEQLFFASKDDKDAKRHSKPRNDRCCEGTNSSCCEDSNDLDPESKNEQSNVTRHQIFGTSDRHGKQKEREEDKEIESPENDEDKDHQDGVCPICLVEFGKNESQKRYKIVPRVVASNLSMLFFKLKTYQKMTSPF